MAMLIVGNKTRKYGPTLISRPHSLVSGMFLFSHHSDRLRSLFKSPTALLRSRYAFVLLFPFFIAILLLRSQIRVTVLRFYAPRPVEVIQQRAYQISSEDQHLECPWTPWHYERYASIINSTSNIYLGMNFFENERILSNFFQELPVLLRHLGPERVYVSVYENGSNDQTPDLLNLCEFRPNLCVFPAWYSHIFSG